MDFLSILLTNIQLCPYISNFTSLIVCDIAMMDVEFVTASISNQTFLKLSFHKQIERLNIRHFQNHFVFNERQPPFCAYLCVKNYDASVSTPPVRQAVWKKKRKSLNLCASSQSKR